MSFEIIAPNSTTPFLLTCEHASPAIPAAFGDLGIAPQYQGEHYIHYDKGAELLTRALSKELGATAILSKYSRAFVDLDRHGADPDCIPEMAHEFVPVPANEGLSSKDRQDRIDQYFTPYHSQVDVLLAEKRSQHEKVLYLPIHTFEKRLDGFKYADANIDRPWHIFVMWDDHAPYKDAFINTLTDNSDYRIGSNEPYSGVELFDIASCISGHVNSPHVPHLLIEVRSDMVHNNPAGVEKISTLLAQAAEAAVKAL